MSQVESMVDELKTLTLLEVLELIRKIEETFNVDIQVKNY